MKCQIYRGASVQFSLLVLLMSTVRVKCRQWQAIIDHDILRKSNIDSSRYELKIETDPFYYPGEKSPTDIPTEAPKADVTKVWTTMSPTTSPSVGSIDGISTTPIELAIKQNDACKNGLKLYEVHMMDTWGDGWDQTMITIAGIIDSMTTTHTNTQGDNIVSISKTIEFDSVSSSITDPNSANGIHPLGQIFQGTLQDGYHDFADVCLLPNRCYELVATGGEFLEEVSWELRPGNSDPESSSVLMEPILTGGAPTRCTFSLPDENGQYLCPITCTDDSPASSISDPFEAIEDSQAYKDEVGTEALTDPPKVTESLQPNEVEVATESLTEALGRVSRPDGTGQSASTLWGSLKLSDTDEHTSN